MEIKPKARLHAIIEGRVQGVGFRFFVVEKATQLALTGWVRNTYDGNVEVVAEGSQSSLDELSRLLKRGPAMAHVSNVKESRETPSGEFHRFTVLPTG